MYRKTRAWAAITAALLATALVGCSAASAAAAGDSRGPGIRIVFEQPLPDGRTVLCIYAGYNRSSGGLSCDWGSAQ